MGERGEDDEDEPEDGDESAHDTSCTFGVAIVVAERAEEKKGLNSPSFWCMFFL